MAVSKKRTNIKKMKQRTFLTIKSARRYINRFKWQYEVYGKYYPKIQKTMAQAIRIKNGIETVVNYR